MANPLVELPSMSPTWWSIVISFAGVVLVLISQRHTAYLARQQQLRIEKHREDPSFPLEPPPSRLRLFIRNHVVSILCICFYLGDLTFHLTRRVPLTASRVLMISLLVAGIVWILLLEEIASQRRAMLEFIVHTNERTWEAIHVLGNAVAKITPDSDGHSQLRS